MNKFLGGLVIGVLLVMLALSTFGTALAVVPSTKYTYQPNFTAQEIADVLTIDPSRILLIQTTSSQCNVEFKRPVRVASASVSEQMELFSGQEESLQNMLASAGCGLLKTKTVTE